MLIFSKPFVKIHIYKNNQCVEALFFLFMQNKSILEKTQPLSSFIQDKSILKEISITIKENNESSIFLAKNPILYIQIQHIYIQYYYIRDEIAR